MTVFFKKRKDLFYSLLISLSSFIFVFDLFAHKGRPATFDALVHITNIAQFSSALRAGDFPVYWENGFANYGLPMGIVAHQLTSYLGAVLNLVFNNPTLSFNILTFAGILISSLLFYRFLRIYFPSLPSFVGTFLFTFAPYRILNVYVRGAEPEVFSNIFLPLILISIYKLVLKKDYRWFFIFVISVSFLALTHPMNLLIYSLIFVPYSLFCLWQAKINSKIAFKYLLLFIAGGFLAIGIAGFYLLPLTIEIKYFYIGLAKNQLAPNHFLGFLNFFTERWAYETAVDKVTRGNILQTGIIETGLFIFGVLLLIKSIVKKEKLNLVGFSILIGFLIVFFTLSISNPIYQALPFLGNIQFPWRMLNGFIFIPPIIASYIFSKKQNIYLVIIFLAIIIFLRTPQLYGKNFVVYPDSIYNFNQKNVHSDLMSTVWMDYSHNYPIKTKQAQIVEGKGKITEQKINNSRREYTLVGQTNLRLLDYTFYFPGWKAYIDGKRVPIQFQDPNYRGLITYLVPAGNHQIKLVFEDSPVRLAGKLVTLMFVGFFVILLVFRNKLKVLINKLY